eukprot:2904533-Rhodomonas_salina.2
MAGTGPTSGKISVLSRPSSSQTRSCCALENLHCAGPCEALVAQKTYKPSSLSLAPIDASHCAIAVRLPRSANDSGVSPCASQ